MKTQLNPKIPFYVQRSFGEKMNASFDFIKENWKIMIKYITYLILPVCLLQALTLNTFVGHYLGEMMADSDFESFDVGFFASYGSTVLLAIIGSLMMTSLIYALMKLYNDREERLCGITFKEIKPLLLRNIGRLFLLGLLFFVFYVLVAVVITLLAAASWLTLILIVPAVMAVVIALLLWTPVYLFENISLKASLVKAFRMGFATWGGVFAIVFIMGLIASILQGVVMTPWYVAVIVKALFVYSDEGIAETSSIFYNLLIYVLGVVQAYGLYLSATFVPLGLFFQYAHASEKLDSVTVESDIDHFENL